MSQKPATGPSVYALLRRYYKEDGRLAKRPFAFFAIRHGDYRARESRHANAFANYIHVAAMIHPTGKLRRHVDLAIDYLLAHGRYDEDFKAFVRDRVRPRSNRPTPGAGTETVSAALPDSLRALLDSGLTESEAILPQLFSHIAERPSRAGDPTDSFRFGVTSPDALAWLRWRLDVDVLDRSARVEAAVIAVARVIADSIDRQLQHAWPKLKETDDPLGVEVEVVLGEDTRESLIRMGECLEPPQRTDEFHRLFEAWYREWVARLTTLPPRSTAHD